MDVSENSVFHYRAYITYVYDGDTFWANIDHGFYIHSTDQKFRMFGINAPEKRKPTLEEGKAARDFLRSLILEKDVLIRTEKDKESRDAKGKYGRWLAEVFIWNNDHTELINVNELMVSKGHAIYKEY